MPRADLLKSGHWRAVYLETRQHGSAGGRWKRTQPVTSHCSRMTGSRTPAQDVPRQLPTRPENAASSLWPRPLFFRTRRARRSNGAPALESIITHMRPGADARAGLGPGKPAISPENRNACADRGGRRTPLPIQSAASTILVGRPRRGGGPDRLRIDERLASRSKGPRPEEFPRAFLELPAEPAELRAGFVTAAQSIKGHRAKNDGPERIWAAPAEGKWFGAVERVQGVLEAADAIHSGAQKGQGSSRRGDRAANPPRPIAGPAGNPGDPDRSSPRCSSSRSRRRRGCDWSASRSAIRSAATRVGSSRAGSASELLDQLALPGPLGQPGLDQPVRLGFGEDGVGKRCGIPDEARCPCPPRPASFRRG